MARHVFAIRTDASGLSSLSIAVYRWLKFFYFAFDCKKSGTAPHHPS